MSSERLDTLKLHCCACDRAAAFDLHVHRCAACGEALEVDSSDAAPTLCTRPSGLPMAGGAAGDDSSRRGGSTAAAGPPKSAGPPQFGAPSGIIGGLWNYAAALPAVDPTLVRERVTMGEGGTPLLAADSLAEELGLDGLWLKDESRNPTGSFKDRGTAVAVAVLAAAGVEAVGTVSTGNMARSVAAYAARADMRSVVWVGAGTVPDKLAPIVVHGADLRRFDAPYGEIYEASLAWGRANEVVFVNSDAALRVEGQKTLALEIADQLAPTVKAAPWVLVPTSSGGNLSALGKGFAEAVRWGWLERSPRLVAVQATGCAPIAAAWEAGEETPGMVQSPATVAGAICNPAPPSGARALRWLRRTEGAAVAVSDEQILAAQQRLASSVGRYLQPASAATLAGLEMLREGGVIDAGDRVVLVLTGGGSNASPPSMELPDAELLPGV